MFTGIVNCSLPLKGLEESPQLKTLSFDFPDALLDGLKPGASVAINGTCLTVSSFKGSRICFDVMMETLRVTNLGSLSVGALVNVERAARFDDEIGGHILSGHVHTTVEVVSIDKPENNCVITFKVPDSWQQYVFPKGFVALNGASLTVGEVIDGCFNIYLIPETLKITTFGQLGVGDLVNLEVDSQTQAIVDTIGRMLDAGLIDNLHTVT